MNNSSSLTENQILVGENLYSKAISIILASASHDLLIFDQDLSRGDFSSAEKYELLKRFLSQNITSQLTIILQDTNFLQQKCPRLLNLLAIYGHKMHVYITNQSVKHVKDCFILADGQHYIKRIHIDQARFKYSLNDTESVKPLQSRFGELKEAIQDIVSVKQLGL